MIKSSLKDEDSDESEDALKIKLGDSDKEEGVIMHARDLVLTNEVLRGTLLVQLKQ